MPTLMSPPSNVCLEILLADSISLERDVQSEAGQEVRNAAKEVHRLWRGRAVQRLSEDPMATAVAGQILRNALERYRCPGGYEGHLVEAAWQLEQMGPEAWPALRELVVAGAQECEYFLGAVVRLEGVVPNDRLATLLAAACNPDANVRSRLLELLEEMPSYFRAEVLRELMAHDRPDDSVTDRAREAGHEQTS